MEPGFVVLEHNSAWSLPSACPRCLRLRAHLNLAAVKFTTVSCPKLVLSEKLPILEDDDCAAMNDEGEGAIAYLRSVKGIDLDMPLSSDEKLEMCAFISLAENDLGDAIEFSLWMDKGNYEDVAIPGVLGHMPWPVRPVLAAWYRRQLRGRLMHYGEAEDMLEHNVFLKSKRALEVLSERLQGNKTFFADRRSSLDAAVFAYLVFIMDVPWKNKSLQEQLERHENLVHFVQRWRNELLLPKSEGGSAPPLTRGQPTKEALGRVAKVKNMKDVRFRRRAKYFLLAQALAIVGFWFFSVIDFSSEDDMEEVDDDEDDD